MTHVYTAQIAPETSTSLQIPFEALIVDYNSTASAAAKFTLKNSCYVEFVLNDSYGDGWGYNVLRLTYSDGTPSEDLTFYMGTSETFVRKITKGVHVTATFFPSVWATECSYVIKYEDGGIVHEELNQQNYEFDVDCASVPNDGNDPVTNLTASVEDGNVTLTWRRSFAAQKYRIARCGIVIGETEETTFTDVLPYEQTLYSVTAIYSDGESLPANILVTKDFDVEENEAKPGFSVYPNPANNILYIKGGDAKYSYVMYNGMGQQVTSGTAQGTEQISVSGMAKGIYFIRFTNGAQVSVQKVVVE